MNESTLDAFLGLKFGASIEHVKEIMIAKPDCVLDFENSDNENIIFNGLKFAGRETLLIMFKFINNKFHTAYVFIKPKLESYVIDLYTGIKNEINDKYYITEEDYETYKFPYEKNDGYAETAISLGKASFTSFWKFKNRDTSENIYNYITLDITENLDIRVCYQDGFLAELYINKQKEKNQADY
jgi:hypothetical protein